jgi:CRISPR system Cascade subunit CasD
VAREYLLFRLWGPLASWGGVAVGEVRGSSSVPGRSALLGLVAAALGIDRADDEAHAELGRSLRFAVLVEASGVPLTDYHTAQLRPPRRGRRDRSRADELAGPRHGLRTILSRREYRCDAIYRIAAWQEDPPGEPSRWSLEDIERALERPRFVPYLGRKANPLGLPTGARRIRAETLPQALAEPDPPEVSLFLRTLRLDWRLDLESPRLYWEGDPEMGDLGPGARMVRRDDPRSRTRWSFQNREELWVDWTAPAALAGTPSGSGDSTEEEGADVPE